MKNKHKREKKDKALQTKKFKETLYIGEYKHLKYFSSLELAVILHCESLGFRIQNYDGDPISYFDPIKNRRREYNPDFLIEDFLIVEVKWIGFVYEKKKLEIEAKKKELENFCQANPDFSCLFVTNDLIKRKFLERAKLWHKGKYERTNPKRGGNVDLRKQKGNGPKKNRRNH
jgi:hypothetical protein